VTATGVMTYSIMTKPLMKSSNEKLY